MAITEPLILPSDVTILPVTRLAARMRRRLRADAAGYAIIRPQGRSRAKLLDARGAALLEEFRSAKRVADGILAYASREGLDPELVLQQAFPLLRDCFNAAFLVPAGSPEAAPILATRARGDAIGRFRVLRCVQLRDDTELYQCRGRDGGVAAVKLLRPGAESHGTPQLRREAAVLRRLAGRGAPALLAEGRHRGRPWIAMSWRHGVASRIAAAELRAEAQSREPLLRLAIGVARAYARLHRNGIVHGDVHPDNLLIDTAGRVTLLDFGLSEPRPPLHLAGRAARGGVAAYLSPEQARAELAGEGLPAPTAASEQYALGALLYTLISGHAPADFALERDPMLRQIQLRPPLPFTRRGLPPWAPMERILGRALAKDPGDRFPSVAAFADALAQVPVPRRRPSQVAPSVHQFDAMIEEFLRRTHYAAAAFCEWPRSAAMPPPTGSLMFGAAGLAYALYRLACLRDDAGTLAVADAWLSRAEFATTEPDRFALAGTDLSEDVLGPVSPYHSIAGIHLVRALLSLATGERNAAERAAERFVEVSATPCEQLDLSFGKAGTLLACTLLWEALTAGGGDGSGVSGLGHAALAGLWARLERTAPDRPGVAHGWAGVLYATLRWCGATESPLPARCAQRLRELAGRAEPLGRGVYWPLRQQGERDPGTPHDIMSGWCNGPAGFIHLWTLAQEHCPDADYLALAEASAWSAWEGRGSIPDLCCGTAGRAYALLTLYRSTGAEIWLDRARALAERAARALRRSRGPRPLSLYKGEPGIVLLLADLHHPETASMPGFESEGWR